MSNPEPD